MRAAEAGTYDSEELPVGSALEFDAVAIEGIGAGAGERWIGPEGLGFPQWPGLAERVESASESSASAHPGSVPRRGAPTGRWQPFRGAIGDRLALARAGHDPARPALLLTTCAASDSAAHAASRRARFPDALAEDMEGFAVALACRLAGVPLSIVRGMSNVAGERDPERWRIPAALAAARTRALSWLQQAGPSS